MKTRRCFIAVEVSEPVIAAVTELLATFRLAGADVRWVNPENLHLTVKFLGELDAVRVEAAREVLREVVPGLPGFSFKVADIGAFPSLRKPKVIWAGIQAPRELAELCRVVDEALTRRGFEGDDRPFRPHLTLGRFRARSAPGDIHQVLGDQGGRSFGRVDVTDVALKESRLTPDGPMYSDLLRVALRSAD